MESEGEESRAEQRRGTEPQTKKGDLVLGTVIETLITKIVVYYLVRSSTKAGFSSDYGSFYLTI